MIRDLDEFLAYLWDHVSFKLLVTGMKKVEILLLSQASVSLPEYVDAIQLMFVVAVQLFKILNPHNYNT